MCGIAGFCNFDADFLQDAEAWTRVLVGMRTAIAHRGSDQTGESLRRNNARLQTSEHHRPIRGGTSAYDERGRQIYRYLQR